MSGTALMNIEAPDDLLRYLRDAGHIGSEPKHP